MGNVLRTTFLMALLIVLFVLVGQAVGGQTGMTIAFLMALGLNFFGYWFSDKIILYTYGAQPIRREDAPELWDMVERLARRAGLPMPKLYVIPSEQPNAFATGRNPKHAAVAVTNGIVRLLNRRELEGVIAHELAHIRHYDILTGTIAATIAGAITYLAQMAYWLPLGRSEEREGANPLAGLLMLILAPLAAMLIQMAISRAREFAADAGGAEICGDPLALASALRKLEAGAQAIPMEASPATAHLFQVSPFGGMARGILSLFSTHPPTEERIRRLEAMALRRG
ncbi:MAG: zinc metalloprotease HtpX [Bacteroidetes bacterium]|nr:zinc metalloprotease HtpX [Rhodothermia bacterium]MCS7155749.1 zinc metalloprotease HtpX [Bacteroidota bacterium]MCX7906150.1 zinc metalloprotease HtpX [Bacteroidota bacterium]MDW8138278.1 zinc metalloprotease HtpX [Bacteroidota bacterium]MDW8285962.1 zinc metalloprotease HtpX [Bacteroidota bacterium]